MPHHVEHDSEGLPIPNRIKAKPVKRPGQIVAAIIVVIFAAMIVKGLITNPRFEWNVVWKYLFNERVLEGVGYTLLLTVISMVVAIVLAVVLAVMRNDGCHRFSAAQGAVRHGGYPRGAAELTARGIPFHAVERELPMGQPFRTIDDARRFFQLYRRPDDTTPVTDDFLRQRLTATGREDFPFFLPQSRRFGMLCWEACEISNKR